MDIQSGNPNFVFLLAFSAAVIALAVWAAIARKRAMTRFASGQSLKKLIPNVSRLRRAFTTALMAGCIALLAIALMDLRWGKTTREVPQKGIEVMFALDVSRSMLAEDASPNRLERAKQQIKDMIDEMAGDRVGLVVFAGEADQAVPLTSHYDDFKQILDTVGPQSINRGGSRLGEAIQAAADGFIGKTDEHKTIVLFTDGEDQESKPVEIARALHEEDGTRVFTVGLGDMDQGSRIPDAESKRSRFVEHEGQQVWSKLNGQILRSIATETDGAYIPAGTKRVNMADVYHGYVANIEQTEFETAKINAYVPRFQWFAGAALLLLLLEVWISTRGVSRAASRDGVTANRDVTDSRITQPEAPQSSYRKGAAAAAAVLMCLTLTGSASARNESVGNQINAANALLRERKTNEAIEAFNKIEATAGDHRDELNYNLGVAHYRNGDFDAAQSLFTEAAQSGNTNVAANSRYNLGNTHYSKALELTTQDGQSAIEELEKAISSYRSSLRLNRDNADARANIELAFELLKKLQQQRQQQQQDQQDQQQQDQQQKNQQGESQQSENQQSGDQQQQNLEQQQSEQQSDDQKNESAQEQQQSEQDPSQREQSSEESQEQQSQQQSEQESSQQDQSDSNQSNSELPEPNQQTEQQQPARQQQNQQKSQPEDEDSPAAREQQSEKKETPTGDLSAVNEQEKDKQNDQKVMAVNPNQEDGLMTKQEALKMLQSVRDRDMLRRLLQQKRQRSRRVPVEKDW